MDGTATRDIDFKLACGRMQAALQIQELKARLQRLELIVGVRSKAPVTTVRVQLRAQVMAQNQPRNHYY